MVLAYIISNAFIHARARLDGLNVSGSDLKASVCDSTKHCYLVSEENKNVIVPIDEFGWNSVDYIIIVLE